MVDEELGRDLLPSAVPSWSWATRRSPAREGRRLLHGGGIRRDADRGPSPGERGPDRAHVDAGPRGRTAGAGDGESRVVRRREIVAQTVTSADQVLVGLNRTRRLYNTRIRELNGFRDPMPAAGEKLVCLRNDKTKGLSTAAPGRSMRSAASGATTSDGRYPRRRAGGGRSKSPSTLLRRRRGGSAVPPAARVRRVHLRLRPDGAQGPGSQWDDLVLFDESRLPRASQPLALYGTHPGRAAGDRRSGAALAIATGGNRISVLRVFRPSSAFFKDGRRPRC